MSEQSHFGPVDILPRVAARSRRHRRRGKTAFVSSVAKASATTNASTQPTRLNPLVLSWSGRSLLLVLWVALGAGSAWAQAAAEYGGATATVGVGATRAKAEKKIFLPAPADKKAKFAHLVAKTEEAPEATNRRALENRAGKNPAKLVLRSVPNRAQVWIDGKPVGNTPLLLILAPGSYKVEMEAPSWMGLAQRQVDLLPREDREVVLSLAPRYPAHVRLR